MVLPTTPIKAPQPAVSPRHALLEELIGIASHHISKQVLGLAQRYSDALLDPNDMTGDAKAAHQRFKAGTLLKKDSYAFLSMVQTHLERTLRREIAQMAPLPAAASQAQTEALALVPYEEMDSRVRYSGISRPFDLLYADALATLNVRLAFLMDREILRPGQNPFRPDVLVMVLQNAWCGFEPDPESQPLLLPLLKPDLFFELGAMFEALNEALKRKGGMPAAGGGARARKSDSHDASSQRKAARQISDQAELTQQLRHFFSSPEAKGVVGSAVSDFVKDAAGIDHMGLDLTLPGLPPADGSAPQLLQPGQAGTKQMLLHQPLMSYLAQLQKITAASAVRRTVVAPDVAAAAARSGPATAPAADAGPLPAAAAADGVPGAPAMTPASPAYLAGIKSLVPQGSLSRNDESTIDLLAAIFQSVHHDQNIAQEIRELIHFLQIPVLKAALADKDFFFKESHPARRLIDLLSHMGWEQRKGPDDPLFKAMQRSVDRVGRDFDQELTVFSDAVEELEASIKVEEQRSHSAMAAPIASALKQEKMAVAAREAKGAVALRVGSGEVLAVLETFLENRWVAVLTIAYGVEDEKPGAVKNATTAMDDLIWSVRPKITVEERKLLIGKLPGLLTTLNAWLDIIKWQDADRLQFFAELAECHASIVRAPIELSPERQVEIALEVAQQAAERRLQLQRHSIPPVAPPPEPDEAVVAVAALERGMWLQFSGDGVVERKVRLAWISPLRTLFIFSTGARQEAFSVGDEALVALFRQDRVHATPVDRLVGRALSQAMAEAAQGEPAQPDLTANPVSTSAAAAQPQRAFG